MYCPRCGQQQAANETKFCSRCGFQMGLIGELIANNGFLPQLAALYAKKPSLFNKKNGVIFSVLWLICFVMMFPAFFGIADAGDVAAVSAVFGLFTTMMFLVISIAFLPSSRKRYEIPEIETMAARNLAGLGERPALPPQQTQPANSYVAPQGAWRSPDTGELAKPGSVIENTTKLLKHDQ